jgi:predicted ATP-dependent endonuclease of OLD family
MLNVEERNRLNGLLKELIPQINTWRVELSRGQTFIQYETHAGAKHAADLFGDGIASLFRVALALMDSIEGSVVTIDEPELSLHPQAQKTLASMLARFAKDRQILITTHSPYLVRWADMSSGAKVYRLTQEAKGVSVGNLRAQTLTSLKQLVADWQKPNLLDAVSREVFFADEVVFLEGQEDVGLLKSFSESRGLPALPAFGYGAGGFGNIKHFLQMARDLNIPAVAIYDGDHAQEKAEAERDFPEALIELLPTGDIRDKPARDKNGRELADIAKVGLFDRHGVLKQEFEEYLTALLARIEKYFAQH